MTEKKEKKKRSAEELHKVNTEEIVQKSLYFDETKASASYVGEIRKGLVSGSSVGQARKEIEQVKGKSQQEEKKE